MTHGLRIHKVHEIINHTPRQAVPLVRKPTKSFMPVKKLIVNEKMPNHTFLCKDLNILDENTCIRINRLTITKSGRELMLTYDQQFNILQLMNLKTFTNA